MGNEMFDTKKCRLTIRSPVHIGSVEQRLTPFEYIRINNDVYFISDERLSHFLKKRNLIEAYVRAVDHEGHRFRLADFFRERGIKVSEEDLVTISAGRCSKVTGDASKLQDLRPFIRDGMGELYIPGTSLKGVFRTAVLFNVLSDMKLKDPSGFVSSIEEKIEKDIFDRANKKRIFEWGAMKWLAGFTLNNKSGSPNTDWLRMLHVTDAYSVEDIETSVFPLNILKKEDQEWRMKTEGAHASTTIWAECVPVGTVFEFQISWDKKILEDFKMQNRKIDLPEHLEGILDNVINWSGAVKTFEEKFSAGHLLQKWYRDNNGRSVNFRVGFGSGMMSTTISPLLSDNLRKKIRNYAGFDRGEAEAPKSRRIWLDNNNQYVPLGWAVLEASTIDTATEKYFHPKPLKRRLTVIPEPSGTDRFEKPTSGERPAETVQVTWEYATLSWSPGNKTLIAICEGKKAELQIGDDRSLVPEGYHKKLFEKKKGVNADIVVESIGNAFKIARFLKGE